MADLSTLWHIGHEIKNETFFRPNQWRNLVDTLRIESSQP